MKLNYIHRIIIIEILIILGISICGCAAANELGTLKTTVGDVQQEIITEAKEIDAVENQTGALNVQSDGAAWISFAFGAMLVFFVWLLKKVFEQRKMLIDVLTSVKHSSKETKDEIKKEMSFKDSKRNVKHFAEKLRLRV